jgi:hypothetical protein
MARKKKEQQQQEDGPTIGHNVADLHKLIRNAASEMTQIKKERAALNERAGDIRTKLKESGVQVKAFEFALRLYEQEPEARNEYLDNLRINFEALSIGAQSEMFPELKGEAPGFVQDMAEPEPVGAVADMEAQGSA